MTVIRPASFFDLDQVALCHRLAFPKAFTSKLGLDYLKSLFGWYLSDDKKLLLVDEEDSNIIGYCGGMIHDGTSAHGSSSSMTQHTFFPLVRAISLRPWLIFRRDFFARYGLIVRNILYRIRGTTSGQKTDSTANSSAPWLGLVVIGVAPSRQGRGNGARLLHAFEAEAQKRGLKKLQLSVKTTNIAAIRSYKSAGWKIDEDKNGSTRMSKEIGDL